MVFLHLWLRLSAKPAIGQRGGRPPSRGIIETLKRKYGRDGRKLIDRLDDLSRHATSEKVRLDATKELCDRGWGRATQTVESASPAPMFNLPPGAHVAIAVKLPDSPGSSPSLPPAKDT